MASCLASERRLLSMRAGLNVFDWQPIIDLERPRPTCSVLPDRNFDLVPVVLEARVRQVFASPIQRSALLCRVDRSPAPDWVGVAVCFVGMAIIMFGPREVV